MNAARAQILAGLCDVALVVGADTTPKGFLAPNAGERWDDPDWLRFRLHGRHQPDLLRPVRAPAHGTLRRDRSRLRQGQGQEQPARPHQSERPLQEAFSEEEVLNSPMVADPLRLFEICATSDGGAAVVLSSMEFARKHTTESGEDRRDLDRHAALPQHGDRDAELRDRLRP